MNMSTPWFALGEKYKTGLTIKYLVPVFVATSSEELGLSSDTVCEATCVKAYIESIV